MKALKIISFVLIGITFSSCYFLDRFIPEEYFAEDEGIEKNNIRIDITSEYVWISHSTGIQCEVKYFPSFDFAIKTLENMGIRIYDSKVNGGATCMACGCPTGMFYSAKIKSTDLYKRNNTIWFFSRDLN